MVGREEGEGGGRREKEEGVMEEGGVRSDGGVGRERVTEEEGEGGGDRGGRGRRSRYGRQGAVNRNVCTHILNHVPTVSAHLSTVHTRGANIMPA